MREARTKQDRNGGSRDDCHGEILKNSEILSKSDSMASLRSYLRRFCP
ncbi:MAG: hypothetical protein RL117_939 [Verrucomicrobiota bacterium]|jgi:hypothetical protein